MMCLSKYNLALRAKFKFETDVFFMISLRKIMKNTSVLRRLFTQPHYFVR